MYEIWQWFYCKNERTIVITPKREEIAKACDFVLSQFFNNFLALTN